MRKTVAAKPNTTVNGTTCWIRRGSCQRVPQLGDLFQLDVRDVSIAPGATPERVVAEIGALRQMSTRGRISAGGKVTGRARRIAQWRVCQGLTEKLLSWRWGRQWAARRVERSWDGILPRQVGLVYRLPAARRNGLRDGYVVVGQPCPNCERGRLALFGHSDSGGLGLYCNVPCLVSGHYGDPVPFGFEIGRVPLEDKANHKAVWGTLEADLLPPDTLSCE